MHSPLLSNMVLYYYRVLFGDNYNSGLFVFVDPIKAEKLKKEKRLLSSPSFESAQQELSKNAHIDLSIEKGRNHIT